MSELAIAAVIAGVMLAVLAAPCLLAPALARAWMAAFPRQKVCGWVLTAVGLAWAARLLWLLPLGPYDRFKPLLYGLTPTAFVLIVLLMDELLAARALGGLLLLVPAPMLDAARWHESNWRYPVTVFAYVLVVAGMTLVLSPFYFRKALAFSVKDDRPCRILGAAGMVLGLIFLALGLTVY